MVLFGQPTQRRVLDLMLIPHICIEVFHIEFTEFTGWLWWQRAERGLKQSFSREGTCSAIWSATIGPALRQVTESGRRHTLKVAI